MNSTPRLILASNSPRRQQLMRDAGYRFEVITFDFPEMYPDTLPPKKVAEFLAVQKNRNYREKIADGIVITSDTTVVKGSEILGKPGSTREAREMLRSLSATDHQVVTGVCISDAQHSVAFSDVTHVRFNPLTDAEIQYYIDHYQPADKAGAYGIQEWIGLTKIAGINGSYFNVMGLPVHLVYETLQKHFGISPVA